MQVTCIVLDWGIVTDGTHATPIGVALLEEIGTRCLDLRQEIPLVRQWMYAVSQAGGRA